MCIRDSFFRDNYERWLRSLPLVTSGVNINRVEVYILNRTNNSESLRNFAAFTDLGEGRVLLNQGNPQIGSGINGPNDNDANLLFENLSSNCSLRDIHQVDNTTVGKHDFNAKDVAMQGTISHESKAACI